jgi:radial spoke head protein 4A
VEKNYLRAQIARITSSTVVCPQGYFQENESGDIVAVEEAEAKTSLQLSDLAGWSHFSKELNEKYGRATPMPPKPDDGVWEGEEFASPLRTLTEDKADSWRVEKLPATLIPSVGEFAVAKSLIWPGAVGIAVGKKFLNVYVGHGVKFSSTSYQIPSPQLLQAGFGIGSKEDQEKSSLSFNSLSEQIDVLEDPNPSASED